MFNFMEVCAKRSGLGENEKSEKLANEIEF